MKLDLYSGSRLKLAEAMWPAYYEARLRLAGSTATIVPIGDPLHGKPDATTFKSVGNEQVVWTPTNTSLDQWATPLDLRQDSSWQGIIPILKFDGSTDWLETPDAPFWNDTAGTSEPSYTLIMWVSVIASIKQQSLWMKTPVFSSGGTDWGIVLNTTEKITFVVLDDDIAAFIGRTAPTLANGWHHIAATKTTGVTNAAIKIYYDGVAADDTNTGFGFYVNQEDGTTVVRIGAEINGGKPLSSPLAGGPLGPLFIPGTVMSADALLRDYQLGRRALAL